MEDKATQAFGNVRGHCSSSDSHVPTSMSVQKAHAEKDKVCSLTHARNSTLRPKPCQGNAAFKANDFPTAIGHYTAAILADPSNATYPLNRAAAYLKLGK